MIRSPDMIPCLIDSGNYIYVLLDSRRPGIFKYENISFDHEPFYVGCGRNERWRNHYLNEYQARRVLCGKRRNCNELNKKDIRIAEMYFDGYLPQAFKIYDKIFERAEALQLEADTVTLIGTEIDATGPLLNINLGKKTKVLVKSEPRIRIVRSKLSKNS